MLIKLTCKSTLSDQHQGSEATISPQNQPRRRGKEKPYSGFGFFILSVCELLSVIRQKDESQNDCFKERKHDKFSEKRTFFIL